jgi:hypothetical protein
LLSGHECEFFLAKKYATVPSLNNLANGRGAECSVRLDAKQLMVEKITVVHCRNERMQLPEETILRKIAKENGQNNKACSYPQGL